MYAALFAFAAQLSLRRGAGQAAYVGGMSIWDTFSDDSGDVLEGNDAGRFSRTRSVDDAMDLDFEDFFESATSEGVGDPIEESSLAAAARPLRRGRPAGATAQKARANRVVAAAKAALEPAS